jgi:hypothetical protein
LKPRFAHPTFNHCTFSLAYGGLSSQVVPHSGYNCRYHNIIIKRIKMKHASARGVSPREAVTIRFPVDLLAQAKQLKKGKESFNELVIEAVEQEVKRRRAITAHQSIVTRRAQIKARTGVQPEATALIRSLRDGEERRD